MFKRKRRMSTPWGPAQNITKIARGIFHVSTAGHGGIHVSPKLNEAIPDYMRAAATRGKPGWYEEDCAWSIPAICFEQQWRAWADSTDWTTGDHQMDCAWRTLADYYPDAYERFTGKTIEVGQSSTKDARLFRARHANDYIVTAAWGDWQEGVPKGFVGVHACRGGRGEDFHYQGDSKYFLIPEEEYTAKGNTSLGKVSHFVVDPTRHQVCPAFG